MINISENIEVCICAYNEEQNIADCIRSIQEAGVFNIHVVDAGSDDQTVFFAKQAGARVTISGKGLASQRQIGLEACRFPFLLYVDADDRLAPSCPRSLLEEMEAFHADAIQASLRVENPQSYWQRGMDALLQHCICIPGPTNMVGRPALYRTDSLLRVGLDRDFDGVGNEDAALSIRMEAAGMVQRIGNAFSYRRHPRTFRENAEAWIKYGRGDARLLKNYPNKSKSVLWHILVRYPILRSYCIARHGEGAFIGFPICAGLVRLIGMIRELLTIPSTNNNEQKS